MTEEHNKPASARRMKRSLNGRILKSTILNIMVLVVISCVIMALSMQSLANSILLDSLQPMVRQSAKAVEANIHLLADRMMTIAGDFQTSNADDNRTEEILTEAAETYEFHAIALYDLEGSLLQGIKDAPKSLDGSFFSLLKETDSLTTHFSTIFQGSLGIAMGMPVKEEGETVMYVVGVYKYDALDDIISSINIGKNGMAYMVKRELVVTGHPDD